MMQDPGREEAASSSASSSATPIQSVEQPAPPCSGPAAMAQMGVVASHQHPGAPALGPGPTASAFYGMPFAGPPRQPTPAASQAGPSGGFQGPSYAGHVHCSPAAAAQAGPSTGFQGAVYAGQVPFSPAAAALPGPSGGCQGALYVGQVPHSSVTQQARRSGPVFPWDTLPTDSTVMSASQKKGDAQAFSVKVNVREDQCGSCFLKTTELFLLENCLHFPFCRQCSIQSSCPKCRVECVSRKQIYRISP
ncbi:Kinesin-like protein KIN-7D, mitochondrial [Frankliniella fusca]|uniref:Kinesin-like protein KIN-7D, mitochondrial n=1 Tax=Frankliniella fusca TaxID=407009 RepID=A0AAE1GZ20_9NEOP|nr:Kinesin-like protein KIN-7D, mitochondrial [Frankliniella fusca]